MADETSPETGESPPPEKSPLERMQENCDRHNYLLSGTQANERMLFALVSWALLYWLVYLIAELAANYFELAPLWHTSTSLVIFLIVAGYTIESFIVSVPEVTGLVTVNRFLSPTAKDGFRHMHVYPSGMHFKYPWEQAKTGNYINLRTVTKIFSEDFPAKDGPLVQIRGSFQYRPELRLLPRYIAVDESTIMTGLLDICTSYLSEKIKSMTAVEAREALKKLEDGVRERFALVAGNVVVDEDERKRDEKTAEMGLRPSSYLSYFYGIEILVVAIGDVGYEEKYQDALTSRQVASKLQEIADHIKETRPGISDKDAYNLALIVNGMVPKRVFEMEGVNADSVGNAIVSIIAAWQAMTGTKK